ncbi:hypothetical protein [Flavobacterium notoginsengisoli]|uniref:hypothetical protein n=1 Tax=Flavobacterium notoginsengisoli TaxID=1478199 RepID=UPI0036291F26
MKKIFIPIGLGVLIIVGALFPEQTYAQTKKEKKSAAGSAVDTIVMNKKEEKNRNVMLNAGSNSSPRSVNIGLPFQDMVVLENDLPVNYTTTPQTPIANWRYDSSIGRIGMNSFTETALTTGRVGMSVSTFDREPGSKFKGIFSVYTNSFGSLIYSGSVSGPIDKKGWGYIFDFHETYDRGSGTNRMYTPWNDRTEIIKTGITKKYKNGLVTLLYKHSDSYAQYSSNQPVIYKGNGKFVERPGFALGSDSYVLADGKIPYNDPLTGESTVSNLGDSKANGTHSQAIYLMGNHNFGNGYKLNYSTMYMHSKAAFTMQYPISLLVLDPDQQYNETTNPGGNQFRLHGQSAVYEGSAQLVNNFTLLPTKLNHEFTKIELTKKFGKHSMRFVFTNLFYENMGQKTVSGIYYQTVEPNPKLLDMYMPMLASYGMNTQITDKNGLLPVKGGDYLEIRTNKSALYFSDDAKLTNWLSMGIGARIEKQDDRETHDQYINDFVLGRPLMTNDFKNKFNHVALASFVANLTSKFGFMGDVTYIDFYNRFYDYPDNQKDELGVPIEGAQTTKIIQNQIHIYNYGAGVFWNPSDKFSITSKICSIKKDNNTANLDVINSENQKQVVPVNYNISTLGLTTDFNAQPFKNFNLHFLLTIQNPEYQNYVVNLPGKTFDYNSKSVPAISKVLMEIDPSYKLGSFRLWASLRYFGKQYGNLTNSFEYAPWWENFAGVDYRLSRNVDFKLQVVNFLDQKGINGSLQGADQIEDATSYIGRTVVAGGMRPRTIEFTVNFKI